MRFCFVCLYKFSNCLRKLINLVEKERKNETVGDMEVMELLSATLFTSAGFRGFRAERMESTKYVKAHICAKPTKELRLG